jgi:hypothetical protein
MDANENELPEGAYVIKLDGSHGFGDRAHLTIITNTPEGDREETFEFPMALIDMEQLNKSVGVFLIKGYKIVRVPKPSQEGV